MFGCTYFKKLNLKCVLDHHDHVDYGSTPGAKLTNSAKPPSFSVFSETYVRKWNTATWSLRGSMETIKLPNNANTVVALRYKFRGDIVFREDIRPEVEHRGVKLNIGEQRRCWHCWGVCRGVCGNRETIRPEIQRVPSFTLIVAETSKTRKCSRRI